MSWGKTKSFKTRDDLYKFLSSEEFQDEQGGMFDPRILGRLADGTWMEIKPFD